MKNTSLRILGFFARSYPLRTLVVVLSLFVMAVMETVGMAAVLPMISVISDGLGAPPEIIDKLVRGFFGLLGLPLTLPYLLGFVVVVMVVKAAMMLLAMWQVAFSSARVVTDLRLALLRSILGANWSYYTAMTTGGTVNALGTEALRSAEVYRQLCSLLAYLMLIVVYTALAFMVSWQITLAAMGIGGLIVLVFRPLIRFGRHYGAQETRLLSDSSARFTDALTSVKPIRAMGREGHYIAMLGGLIRDMEVSQERKIIATDTAKYVSEPVIVVFVAAGLYFAVQAGGIPLTQMLFLAFLFHRLVTRMIVAQRLYQIVIVNESALNALRDRIEEARAEEEDAGGQDAPSLRRGIVFENVSFSYGDTSVLKGVTAVLDARKFHAVIGGSGAGKTTFIDLLIGLHRPKAGTITVDGVDLRQVDLRLWRAMIGYVPQDVMLFHDTVYNNVTLGDGTISRQDAEEALKAAGAWPFVSAMDGGLDSVVGEGGARLSGGQRQRIAIARAIVRKPVLLVLDEATSALDRETEKDIWHSIKALVGDMTVIAISHQDAVLSYADHVLRLENGTVKEAA